MRKFGVLFNLISDDHDFENWSKSSAVQPFETGFAIVWTVIRILETNSGVWRSILVRFWRFDRIWKAGNEIYLMAILVLGFRIWNWFGLGFRIWDWGFWLGFRISIFNFPEQNDFRQNSPESRPLKFWRPSTSTLTPQFTTQFFSKSCFNQWQSLQNGAYFARQIAVLVTCRRSASVGGARLIRSAFHGVGDLKPRLSRIELEEFCAVLCENYGVWRWSILSRFWRILGFCFWDVRVCDMSIWNGFGINWVMELEWINETRDDPPFDFVTKMLILPNSGNWCPKSCFQILNPNQNHLLRS